jgi:hypothetical protein
MKVLGALLVILGIIGFAMGGLKFTRKETVANLGPLEVTQSKTQRIPITPIAAGAAVIAGIALIAMGSSRRAS